MRQHSGLHRTVAVAALGVGLLLGTACGGDDDDAADEDSASQEEGNGNGGTRDADTDLPSDAPREEYVAALIAASAAERMTPEQNTCFAESIVDAIGLERLAAAVSPQEIQDRQETNLVELGVDVAEEDGQRFYELVNACADLRELLVQEVVGGQGLASGVRPCLDTELSDDLLRRLMADGFTQSSAELAQDTAILDEIRAAFTACTPTTTAPPG